MGCGISKFGPEDKRTPNPDVRFVYPRKEQDIASDVKEGGSGRDQEETDSVTSHGRKSVSSLMNYERGFLKRVFGNTSERGTDKEMEPSSQGRKSVSSSSHPPIILENGLFEKESGSFARDHDNNNNNQELINAKRVDSLEKAAKDVQEERRRPSFEMAKPCMDQVPVQSEACGNEDHKQVNGDEFLRENSLLFPPGSPSFRIYCLIDDSNDHVSYTEDESNGGNALRIENEKERESRPAKRGRKTTSILRSVLQRGGSAGGMKNFLNVSYRSVNSSTSQATKLVEKNV